jgi:hypothetical protein
MTVAILGAKAVLAVMLLVAGAAKLAGLDGFAATVRLFLPRAVLVRGGALARAPRWIALAVAAGEVALGGASLGAPQASWLNPVVLAAGCAFVLVSVAGFAFHRGRSCRCFGALSQRRFDLPGIGRSVAVAVLAGVTMAGVPASSVRLGPGGRGLLIGAALLLALVAFTAARVLAASRDFESGMVS